jgi:HEAT repeat protein
MTDVVALVEHYLREWDSAGWPRAYHSLIELGAPALPELQSHFRITSDPVLRIALVEIATQMHSTDALPLFALALRDKAPSVWKAALDGLVDLASPDAILLLEQAVAAPPPGQTNEVDWRSWLDEALEQARAALRARDSVA